MKFFGIIPKPFQSRGIIILLGVIFRAVLDFASIAAMVSILLFMLSDEHKQEYIWIAATVGLIFIILKNITSIFIDRSHSKYILSIYKYLSAKSLETYYDKGLLNIKNSGVYSITYNVNFICYSFVTQVLAPMLRIFAESILLIFIIIALTIYSPKVMLILLLCYIPIILIYIYLIRKRAEVYGNRENQAKRKQWQNVEELFRGYAEVETSQAYNTMSKHFKDGLDEISRNRIGIETIQRAPIAMIEIAMALAILILVLAVGAEENLKTTLGIYGIAAFRILPAIRTLMASWLKIKNNSYTLEVISDINHQTTDCSLENITPIPFNKEIRVESLSFNYPSRQNETISELSLTVEKGEMIGIQGISGAGKTTLFNILLGFFPPNKGGVYIDDVKLTKDNRASWQSIVGYVPQEVFIIYGTVAQNIAFGVNSENIDIERINEIVKNVKLDKWVATLPKGIENSLGESGYQISGGERQRIGIARVLYQKNKVLFLDEATSALDHATEKDILYLIKELSQQDNDLTILMVAHRDSSLHICDRIIII